MARPLTRFLLPVLAGIFLAGCDDFLDETKDSPKLPGKRISVLSHETALKPEASKTKSAPIQLPPPDPNETWDQAGGSSNHAMHHLEINDSLEQAWSTNVGEGSSNRSKLLAQPIVAAGHVFTVDSANQVTALSVKSGRKVWQRDLLPEDVRPSSSGGIAYEDGRLFVTTNFAQVIALDAKTGKVLWQEHVSAPVRGAPTVRAGRVVVVTVDDHTYCMASDDGQVLWTHQGTIEAASMLAGNSPAIDGNVVVVPYASGELFALRIENGSVLWQDSVANVSRNQGVATLTDITGRPIIDRGRVFVMGHADVLVAIDIRTGKRLWDRDIGGIQSPWVAGDYLFLITNNNELVAVDAKTGDLAWVTQLQTWEDTEKKKGRVVWTGPILASNRLIIASNTGFLASVSPYTGAILGQMEIGDGISVPPVVANHSLYFYTDEADVLAYR